MIKITAPKPLSWQSYYNHLLSTNRDEVTCNIMFDNDDYRLVPWGAAAPKDWDVIIPGYWLAVSISGILNVDSGGPSCPNIETSAIDEEKRTLKDCVRFALRDYYYTHNAHYPKVHPSWYGWILENDLSAPMWEDSDFIF